MATPLMSWSPTICTVHNAFGKIYLFFIIPFHRHGVRSLMSRAVAAKRL